MVYSKVSNQYKRSNIETAGKLELIIMCYEKAILCLNQAKIHSREKDYAKKGQKLKKALDIINELQSCLNMEKGGVIARNLDSIYAYMINRLLIGDIQRDLTAFDDCANILDDLKGSWEEIAHLHEEERIAAIPKHDSGFREGLVIAA